MVQDPAQEPPWRRNGDAVLLSLRLTPKSSRDALEGVETLSDGRRVLKARVRAVPEDGKANAAVIKELATAFGLRPRDFTIVHGVLSRDKRLVISGANSTHSARYEELKSGLTLL